MVSDQTQLDWHGDEVDVRLNPRWPAEDFRRLRELAQTVSVERALRAHIWVATSGSTAEKISGIKLVALPKQAFLNSAAAVNLHLRAEATDVWAQVLPLFHVGGIGIEARAFLSGARVVSALKDDRWDAEHYHRILSEQGCSLSALVPTQVYDLVQKDLRAPSSLRAIVVGGGAFSADLYRQARALGWPVLPSYGMSETCSQIATASLESLKQDEYPPIPLLSHAEARSDAEGFLNVRCRSLLTCYAQWRNDRAESWDPCVNGWFRSEDKGEVREGALVIHGRQQDFIKVGGEAVLLSRLRDILEKHLLENDSRLLRDLALIESPSNRLGHEIHLIYGGGATLEDAQRVQKAYDERVLPFERIRRLHAVDEIPRSALGKILYGELKKKVLT